MFIELQAKEVNTMIHVMVNGLPGNMAELAARLVLADDQLELVPWSLTGPEIDAETHTVEGTAVTLIRPETKEDRISGILENVDGVIAVDFTHPTAVNENADFYCRRAIPFVMGTTGGDRQKLEEAIRSSRIAAVVAPNMAKQIVGFQAMMAYAADAFPGLFAGYELSIRESHQKGKADTSGTAKAMVDYFNRLGVPFPEEAIVKERDPAVQKEQWSIPEDYLSGHGWHTYRLVSSDGTVAFEFTHNVNGREVYARGTLDAVRFLDRRLAEGAQGHMYSMIDVLKGG